MTRLADVTSVIRSKNAGPYELTLDIILPKNSGSMRRSGAI